MCHPHRSRGAGRPRFPSLRNKHDEAGGCCFGITAGFGPEAMLRLFADTLRREASAKTLLPCAGAPRQRRAVGEPPYIGSGCLPRSGRPRSEPTAEVGRHGGVLKKADFCAIPERSGMDSTKTSPLGATGTSSKAWTPCAPRPPEWGGRGQRVLIIGKERRFDPGVGRDREADLDINSMGIVPVAEFGKRWSAPDVLCI